MANINVAMTLDDAVQEVLGFLHGLDLTYTPEFDSYYAATRQLNRALRSNALEVEWSYYSSVENVGYVQEGDRAVALRSSVRPRIIGDDAVRLVDRDGIVRVWAYILPRDSLHKYIGRKEGLWASVTRSTLTFSRPLYAHEAGLSVQVPVMREPRQFILPKRPEGVADDVIEVPEEVREQLVDFDYPDLITMKAAYLIAQSDPVMQPRVQTLDDQYKDMMYQLKERDERNTDAPFLNEFFVPIAGALNGPGSGRGHGHPHSDERWSY